MLKLAECSGELVHNDHWDLTGERREVLTTPWNEGAGLRLLVSITNLS